MSAKSVSQPRHSKLAKKKEEPEEEITSSDESQHDQESSESEQDTEEEDDERSDEDEILSLNRSKHGVQPKRRLVCDEDGDEESMDIGQSSQNTKKRKRRATSPTTFGAILSQALQTSESSAARGPATLLTQASRAALRQAKQDAILDANRKQSASKRHELQERGHIKDVIGGWTPRPALPFSEWLIKPDGPNRQEVSMVGGVTQEKALRRLAQTGVVKLFNAIRAAQNVADTEIDATAPINLSGAQKRKLNKLAGSKSLNKSTLEKEEVRDESETVVSRVKPNVLGSKGKEQALANLSKASFLELIKSSGSKKIAE
ncbi:hypothetical protein CROQUDRAFT_668533 [Cronartium quercuum f. sp. fusiforme G11]|uniref:Rrp15p-domain-containing protein n=1 Tax=Cronartium quercuum f. sp. fusiforme G11 TaxID=708437 RepID=A0A9P6NNH0_9BASI|nr:hypothetical protein CROQUDRAFT_668533 [Cronartium quercuum f. sp. fusiforme G11]